MILLSLVDVIPEELEVKYLKRSGFILYVPVNVYSYILLIKDRYCGKLTIE
jgi:hypothetical protein